MGQSTSLGRIIDALRAIASTFHVVTATRRTAHAAGFEFNRINVELVQGRESNGGADGKVGEEKREAHDEKVEFEYW